MDTSGQKMKSDRDATHVSEHVPVDTDVICDLSSSSSSLKKGRICSSCTASLVGSSLQ